MVAMPEPASNLAWQRGEGEQLQRPLPAGSQRPPPFSPKKPSISSTNLWLRLRKKRPPGKILSRGHNCALWGICPAAGTPPLPTHSKAARFHHHPAFPPSTTGTPASPEFWATPHQPKGEEVAARVLLLPVVHQHPCGGQRGELRGAKVRHTHTHPRRSAAPWSLCSIMQGAELRSAMLCLLSCPGSLRGVGWGATGVFEPGAERPLTTPQPGGGG